MDEIKTDSVIINMQLDKSSSMIEYLGNSIDNLKTAYDKLKSFDESSNRQLYEEAMAFYDKAFENIRQALLIQDEYYKLINTYIQKI